jgi:hypothetical protein
VVEIEFWGKHEPSTFRLMLPAMRKRTLRKCSSRLATNVQVTDLDSV